MRYAFVIGLALVTAQTALAAVAASPAAAQTPPTYGDWTPNGNPNPQIATIVQQTHAQLGQLRLQARSRMLAALTPAHRTLVANAIGQLALSVDPNPRAVATQLDAALAPAEKQSIVAIDAAARANGRAIVQRQRSAFAATLSADARAALAAREAKMEAFRASHPRPAYTPDAGAIVLRTLGTFVGGKGGFGERPSFGFEHAGPPPPGS